MADNVLLVMLAMLLAGASTAPAPSARIVELASFEDVDGAVASSKALLIAFLSEGCGEHARAESAWARAVFCVRMPGQATHPAIEPVQWPRSHSCLPLMAPARSHDSGSAQQASGSKPRMGGQGACGRGAPLRRHPCEGRPRLRPAIPPLMLQCLAVNSNGAVRLFHHSRCCAVNHSCCRCSCSTCRTRIGCGSRNVSDCKRATDASDLPSNGWRHRCSARRRTGLLKVATPTPRQTASTSKNRSPSTLMPFSRCPILLLSQRKYVQAEESRESYEWAQVRRT
jgi:hypothetical protein